MLLVHLSCNVEMLSKKLLMKFVARMSGVSKLFPFKAKAYCFDVEVKTRKSLIYKKIS